MSPTPEELQSQLDAAAERSAKAEAYRLSDGTQVNRPKLGEVMDARREVAAEVARKKRKGMFARIGFGSAQ